MLVFIFASGTGLFLSVIVHSSTYFDIYFQNKIPEIWLLHFGIFIVMLPVLLVQFKYRKSLKGQPDNWYKKVIKYSPKWLIVLCVIFFIYGVYNFFAINDLNQGGVPTTLDGNKVLLNHGKIIKYLTNEEYIKHEAYSLRTFSAAWMLFYPSFVTLRDRSIQGKNYSHFLI